MFEDHDNARWSLDKSSTQRRLHNKGKHENEIDLQIAGSIGREKQEREGNCGVRSGGAQLLGFNLAICGATQHSAVGQSWHRNGGLD